MKKYTTYKPSGIDWIGDIPDHWNIKRIKYLFKSIVEKSVDGSEELLSVSEKRGIIPRREIRDENEELTRSETLEGYLLVKKGDLVNNIMLMWKRGLGVSKYDGIVSPSYSVFRINEPNNSRYWDYLLRTDLYVSEFRKNSTGIIDSRLRLYDDSFGEIYSILPPLPEQHQIVQFLDEKTEIIDKLISTKERKIELLKEQRTSLINQVITKGLNPNVKMKDSGVEWIGEIPEHWNISKFKYDTSSPVQYGLNISGDKYKEEGIRFIRITDLTEEGELILEDGKYLDEIEVPKEFFLNKYDVLFCRSGHTVGKSYLHLQEGKYTSGGYLVRFNFRNYYQSKFIFYLGKTSFYWDWIKLNSVISTIENVNGDKYQNFQYPKPPIEEQQQIVKHFETITKEIDDLMSLEQKKIEVLKEYRQSLISEVITGKIKVNSN